MKLTRKGLLKIVGDIVVDSHEYLLSKTLDNWNRTRDFDQDDFEGVICLTVEEAKEIAEKLKDLSEGFFLQTGKIDSRATEWMICLIERIEQAEMSMQSTQCENVSKKDEKIITLTAEEAEGK